MIYIPSQDRFALVTTPQNDIKMEKSQGEDRLGDAAKRERKCDYCGKSGHTTKNIESYTVALPKAMVVEFQVLRNPMFI